MSLDIDPKTGADVICDLLTWEYTDSLEPPAVIWCSPPCTMYSRARTRAKTPRDLEGADKLVQRCLDIIAYWKPKVWFMENPQTGLLKSRLHLVQGLPFVDLDYCMYGKPYRKRTRIWTNAAWTPRPPCTHALHAKSAQRGPSSRKGGAAHGDGCTLAFLHALPEQLTQEILEVAVSHCANEMRPLPL